MKSLCFALATASVRPAASGGDGSYCRGGPDTADPGNFKCRDAWCFIMHPRKGRSMRWSSQRAG
jgi:hypothetical protein